MSGHCRSIAAREYQQLPIELRGQGPDRQDVHASGSEFDCERNTVESAAYVGDARRVVVVEFESTIYRLCALSEELDRRVSRP